MSSLHNKDVTEQFDIRLGIKSDFESLQVRVSKLVVQSQVLGAKSSHRS